MGDIWKVILFLKIQSSQEQLITVEQIPKGRGNEPYKSLEAKHFGERGRMALDRCAQLPYMTDRIASVTRGGRAKQGLVAGGGGRSPPVEP